MIIIITAISAVIASVSLDCHARRGAATLRQGCIYSWRDGCFSPARPNTTHVHMGHGMAHGLTPSLARPGPGLLEPNPCWPLELQGPLHLSLSLVVRVVRGQKLLSAATANDKAYAAKSPTSANTKHALQMPTSFFFLFSKLMSAPQEFWIRPGLGIV